MRKSEMGDSKGSFKNLTAPRFDRKNDYLGGSREGFAPSGQPSRRGRGSIRMRGGISRRTDGYGPPSAKSPFGHQDDKKEKPTDVTDEKGSIEEEKGKSSMAANLNSSSSKGSVSGSKASQVPPRMQKKMDTEQRYY